jgi:hypothetical protein
MPQYSEASRLTLLVWNFYLSLSADSGSSRRKKPIISALQDIRPVPPVPDPSSPRIGDRSDAGTSMPFRLPFSVRSSPSKASVSSVPSVSSVRCPLSLNPSNLGTGQMLGRRYRFAFLSAFAPPLPKPPSPPCPPCDVPSP